MNGKWCLEHSTTMIVPIHTLIPRHMVFTIIPYYSNEVYRLCCLVLDNILLSGDIEYVDYATMSIDGDNFDYFNNQQNIIESNYTSVVNARFGAELNLSPLLLELDMLKLNLLILMPQLSILRDERKSYSFGVGKRNQFSYIDLAYVFRIFKFSIVITLF